jgi:hypothetical protein
VVIYIHTWYTLEEEQAKVANKMGNLQAIGSKVTSGEEQGG